MAHAQAWPSLFPQHRGLGLSAHGIGWSGDQDREEFRTVPGTLDCHLVDRHQIVEICVLGEFPHDLLPARSPHPIAELGALLQTAHLLHQVLWVTRLEMPREGLAHTEYPDCSSAGHRIASEVQCPRLVRSCRGPERLPCAHTVFAPLPTLDPAFPVKLDILSCGLPARRTRAAIHAAVGNRNAASPVPVAPAARAAPHPRPPPDNADSILQTPVRSQIRPPFSDAHSHRHHYLPRTSYSASCAIRSCLYPASKSLVCFIDQ